MKTFLRLSSTKLDSFATYYGENKFREKFWLQKTLPLR